ncbi:GuaB3 family IMP dehydrogenase-related protein [Corynebacterium caspium]|uniref:GuaB3 family IMP dehydrogenase-related protein n=1 Tax=Corynebacterium caspium TaxID=234828 RepID=UPI00036DC0F5|nr:GuaB3 family IMP dehydrogenase-related protein [Corynebacterium caspium]WKD59785.1 putative oxidoreductase [Corynebacterium caspium DSM 44850]
MRDYVEIGHGREARRTYRLADISISASRRTRSSRDVDTTWNIDAYSFQIPVMSHPTDSLAAPEFVKEMNRLGGLAVINAEGLWGRHVDLDGAISRIIDAGPHATQVLQELHAVPVDFELLAQRIADIRTTDATVAVRVSPQNAREFAPQVIKAGAELLIIQGTMISAEHVQEEESLNLKEFIGTLEVPVIAGGVSDYSTAMHLMRAGAVGVIVGGGTNTNETTLGIATPMATAIADVAAARREYLDETGGRYVHIIADGEISTSGEVAKAIACGADAVVLGEPLACAQEAPAQGYYWPAVAAHPRFPRGVVAAPHKEEFFPLEVLLQGPSTDASGHHNLVGGLRRAMAKCGYTDLKSFQKVGLTVS